MYKIPIPTERNKVPKKGNDDVVGCALMGAGLGEAGLRPMSGHRTASSRLPRCCVVLEERFGDVLLVT